MSAAAAAAVPIRRFTMPRIVAEGERASQVDDRLTDAQTKKRDAKATVAGYLLQMQVELGEKSHAKAVSEFIERHQANALPSRIYAAMAIVSLKKYTDACPKRATLYNWIKQYKAANNGEPTALAPKHKGRKRTAYGWEARVLHYLEQPGKIKPATIAWLLKFHDGFEDATDARVRRYIATLPTNRALYSPSRVGRHHYDQNHKPYQLIDYSGLPVGHIYEGDGHTCDFYIQHPVTGTHYRPEFTVWIDKRSRKIVGHWLDDSEKALGSINSLTVAIGLWNHVPPRIHIDPGPGFVADHFRDFCAKLNIEMDIALAGNAKGKGQVEKSFGTFINRFARLQSSYCGRDRTDDNIRRLDKNLKEGNVTLMTKPETEAEIERYIENYNNTPHSGLNGQTPNELWQQLQRYPINLPLEQLGFVREERVVRRGGVSFRNRIFRNTDLAAYEGIRVIVEIDPSSYKEVAIRDGDGRFICTAALVTPHAYKSASLIEEDRERSTRAAIQRKQKFIDEYEARNRPAITHDQATEKYLEYAGSDEAALEDLPKEEAGLFSPALFPQPEKIESNFDGEDFDPLDCL